MNNVMLTGKKLMGLDPTQRTTITLGKLEKERWFSPGKIISIGCLMSKKWYFILQVSSFNKLVLQHVQYPEISKEKKQIP